MNFQRIRNLFKIRISVNLINEGKDIRIDIYSAKTDKKSYITILDYKKINCRFNRQLILNNMLHDYVHYLLEEINVIKILGYPEIDFNYLDDYDLRTIDDIFVKHFKEQEDNWKLNN